MWEKYEVVFFFFGYSPAAEIYVPTFRNALFHLHMWFPAYTTYEDGTDRVFRNLVTLNSEAEDSPKRKKNMAKVWNHEYMKLLQISKESFIFIS